MWELFKARTGAAAPLLKKIKLPGKQSWSHRLFPNAGESCAFCKSVSEFHQLFCRSTIWRPFAGADLWTSPWSSSESDTFTWSAKPQKNDRTAWPLRQRQRHSFSGLHHRTDMSKLKPGAKAEGRGSSSDRCLSAAREIHQTRRYICVSMCLFLFYLNSCYVLLGKGKNLDVYCDDTSSGKTCCDELFKVDEACVIIKHALTHLTARGQQTQICAAPFLRL